MSASRAVRWSVIVVLGFVVLLPGSAAAQPAATAPRTFELAELQRAAIESDPRMLKGVGLDYVWRETLILAAMAAVLLTASVHSFKERLE